MIVVDASALIAILLNEPDADRFARALTDATRIVIGAPTLFETQLVATRRLGAVGVPLLMTLMSAWQFEVASWTADHVTLATAAFQRFGGRPARLNFGDCMAYALARSLEMPLLYKGGDFAATDIRPALPPAPSPKA